MIRGSYDVPLDYCPQFIRYPFTFVVLSSNEVGPLLVDGGDCVLVVVKVAG